MKTQSQREQEEQGVSSNGSDGQEDPAASSPQAEMEARAAGEADVTGETVAGDGSEGTALGADWLQEAQVPAPEQSASPTKGPVAGGLDDHVAKIEQVGDRAGDEVGHVGDAGDEGLL